MPDLEAEVRDTAFLRSSQELLRLLILRLERWSEPESRALRGRLGVCITHTHTHSLLGEKGGDGRWKDVGLTSSTVDPLGDWEQSGQPPRTSVYPSIKEEKGRLPYKAVVRIRRSCVRERFFMLCAVGALTGPSSVHLFYLFSPVHLSVYFHIRRHWAVTR